MTLYIPPYRYEGESPLIFLAGPINSAPRWQNEAVQFIGNEIHIASPRYIEEDQDRVGDWASGLTSEEQIDWESYHLGKAGERGVILFWLSREETHDCTRAFAQTTRFELGEWKEKHSSRGAQLVVGIDPAFSGGNYIRYRLKDCPAISIESTLEETCRRAKELVLRSQ